MALSKQWMAFFLSLSSVVASSAMARPKPADIGIDPNSAIVDVTCHDQPSIKKMCTCLMRPYGKPAKNDLCELMETPRLPPYLKLIRAGNSQQAEVLLIGDPSSLGHWSVARYITYEHGHGKCGNQFSVKNIMVDPVSDHSKDVTSIEYDDDGSCMYDNGDQPYEEETTVTDRLICVTSREKQTIRCLDFRLSCKVIDSPFEGTPKTVSRLRATVSVDSGQGQVALKVSRNMGEECTEQPYVITRTGSYSLW